jgi:hypothetical protein
MMRMFAAAALLVVATTAIASPEAMTPQQTMEKMMNCPVCSAWSAEPALGPTMRYSIETTKTGYVETLSTSDESMKPTFDKCAAECEKRAAGIASMSADEKGKLCAFCVGRMQLMGRKDLSFENVSSPQGIVTVATASSPEGVKALHSYAAAAQKQADMMAEAHKSMQSGTMKSKM